MLLSASYRNNPKEAQSPVVLSAYSLNKAPAASEQILVTIHKDNFKRKGLPRPASFPHAYAG